MAAHKVPDNSQVERFRMKKLIKFLSNAKGNGTSMISLICPPNSQISQPNKMLTDELSASNNIKNRVNRLSVQGAIVSTQQKLKGYSSIPDNGLVIYCGTVITEDGKDRKVVYDIIPFKPINTSMYLCDNRFHVEPLIDLLSDDDSYGFIVIDGKKALFGKVSGNTRETIHQFTVELPPKHGRGGQSALRFSRLREEARRNYVRKVGEQSVRTFITNDKPNISGLILAGSADFKTVLSKSDLLDKRLLEIVINIVDVANGGETGFNEAITLSSEVLNSVKLVREKELLGKYFESISVDNGKFSFGVKDTMFALTAGAVKTLIVYEDLDVDIIHLLDNTTGNLDIKYLTPLQRQDQTFFHNDEGVELSIEYQMLLTEWLAEHHGEYGACMKFVTDASQEGTQFVRGFGGIGSLLRYPLTFDYDLSSFDRDEYSSFEEGDI